MAGTFESGQERPSALEDSGALIGRKEDAGEESVVGELARELLCRHPESPRLRAELVSESAAESFRRAVGKRTVFHVGLSSSSARPRSHFTTVSALPNCLRYGQKFSAA